MKKASNYFKKTLTSILIVAFLFAQAPAPAHALWGVADVAIDPSDIGFDIKQTVDGSIQTAGTFKDLLKEFALDKVAYVLASRIAEKLTQRVVNWANSGFDGNPFFIKEDFKSFFVDLGKDVATGVVYDIRGNVDSPFANTIVRAIERDWRESFKTAAQDFTLDDLFGEGWEEFDTNFAGSGQNPGDGGWLRYTESWKGPNNPFGAYLETGEQLKNKVTSQERSVSLDLQSNQGYLSFQKCVDPEGWQRGDTETIQVEVGEQDSEGQLAIPTVTQTIPVPCKRWETQTPGNAIYEQATKALDEPLNRLAQANEFGQIVAASLNAMIGSLVKGGMKKLSSTINSGITNILTQNVSSPEDVSELTQWANQADILIDLDKELEGYVIEYDEDGVQLLTPIVIPGAVELLSDEIETFRDIINNEDWGLEKWAEQIMALDHAFPGPDTGWIERLRDAIQANKRYKRFQKRQRFEDELSAVQQEFIRGGREIQAAILDPDNQIENYGLYWQKIQQRDTIREEVGEINAILERKSQVLVILNIIKSELTTLKNTYSGDLDSDGIEDYKQQPEYASLARQYSRLAEKTTPEQLEETRERADAIRQSYENLGDDLVRMQAEIQARKANPPADYPEWGRQYDQRVLFCEELVDSINRIDGKIELRCSQFYTSDLVDYIDATQTL